jgi:hypothetical protein
MRAIKENSIALGWGIASVLAILLLIQALGVMRTEHLAEIKKLEGKIADYEEYIATLDAAYDSLLVEEIELIERHDEEILTFDTLGVDSLRGYFASRYGFFNVLHADTTAADSTGH